jgi:hypothetical protein
LNRNELPSRACRRALTNKRISATCQTGFELAGPWFTQRVNRSATVVRGLPLDIRKYRQALARPPYARSSVAPTLFLRRCGNGGCGIGSVERQYPVSPRASLSASKPHRTLGMRDSPHPSGFFKQHRSVAQRHDFCFPIVEDSAPMTAARRPRLPRRLRPFARQSISAHARGPPASERFK